MSPGWHLHSELGSVAGPVVFLVPPKASLCLVAHGGAMGFLPVSALLSGGCILAPGASLLFSRRAVLCMYLLYFNTFCLLKADRGDANVQ